MTLLGTALCVGIAAGLVGIVGWLRIKVSHSLTVTIADDSTRVTDDDGRCLVEMPTTITYVEGPNGIHVVAFGSDAIAQGSESDTIHLSLAKCPDDAPVELLDVWGAYVTYCCEKARRRLNIGQWRPFRVTVIAKTSNSQSNEHFRRQAASKALRWIGEVRAGQMQ